MQSPHGRGAELTRSAPHLEHLVESTVQPAFKVYRVIDCRQVVLARGLRAVDRLGVGASIERIGDVIFGTPRSVSISIRAVASPEAKAQRVGARSTGACGAYCGGVGPRELAPARCSFRPVIFL